MDLKEFWDSQNCFMGFVDLIHDIHALISSFLLKKESDAKNWEF